MKAIGYHTYGSPDVLELQEVAKPVPKEHEILIHVHAAAITPTDIVFRKGVPFLVRVFTGLRRPKKIPGTEFAGDIEAVGTAVTLFQTGDQVFGINGKPISSFSESLLRRESSMRSSIDAIHWNRWLRLIVMWKTGTKGGMSSSL